MKFSSRLAIKNLTIVGAGQMGAGIAQVGAVTGHQVVLNDISEKTLARAQSGIEKSLKRMTKKMSSEDADAFMTNTLRYDHRKVGCVFLMVISTKIRIQFPFI